MLGPTQRAPGLSLLRVLPGALEPGMEPTVTRVSVMDGKGQNWVIASATSSTLGNYSHIYIPWCPAATRFLDLWGESHADAEQCGLLPRISHVVAGVQADTTRLYTRFLFETAVRATLRFSQGRDPGLDPEPKRSSSGRSALSSPLAPADFLGLCHHFLWG